MTPPHSSTDDEFRRARLDLLHAGRRKQDLTPFQSALAEAKIANYIEKTLAAAPPLTAEARDRLASLLQDSP